MKPAPSIISLALLLTAAAPLRAQETNTRALLDWSAFSSIGDNNIFDPSRRDGRSAYVAPVHHSPVVMAFVFHGSDEVGASFTGEGVPSSGFVAAGDTLNGFKVMQITLHRVKLVDPSGAITDLKTGDSMRREDSGPWTKSDEPPPVTLVVSPISSDASPSASGTSPAGESDILKKLRLKREQEAK